MRTHTDTHTCTQTHAHTHTHTHTHTQLKSGKSAGHDLLQPEHLKHGGEALKIWIQQVCNAIVELSVPNSLKLGIVTPIYKGGGKDPVDTNSYRGITLTPVLAKVFESLILNPRCAAGKRDTSSKPNGLPEESFMCGGHLLDHGSCLAICPAGQEDVHMLYDLQKAFDSVQYPVLLEHLYEAGINGKTWRLIKDWYNHPRSRVKVGGQLSAEFSPERGVLQGSVLSPVFFLLVMDPLLRELEHNRESRPLCLWHLCRHLCSCR